MKSPSESTVRGVNPFPGQFRRDCFVVDHLPILNERGRICSTFIRQLGRQRRYPLSDLAGECYAIAISQDYYFWDVLATAYLAVPERYELQTLETGVITRGESQGRIVLRPGGRTISMMRRVDLDWFYPYILGQWRR